MPPKDAKKGKGAPVGNYKAGKQLKDILPPNTKAPREGQPVKVEGEPDVHRSYAYEPYPAFPEWPGNEEAKKQDFMAGIQKNEDDTLAKFEDPTEIFLPPSFQDYEKNGIQWLRPEEYLREIAYDNEVSKKKAERKQAIKKKKTMRKQSILAMGNSPNLEEMSNLSTMQKGITDKDLAVNREDITFEVQCISYDQRLETEEEVKKRKEEAEKLAALDKNAKKKPPPKGQPVADPMDEPQLIKVAVENTMDMGFLMPIFSKWATSQFQFIKDRSIRDIDTRETIWQRIYPQENGIPVVSPSGRYWVKIRFMGKERMIEIDDRMPCDAKKKLMFPRTINNFEIWPQLLLKALLKVYSYKWFSSNAQFDQEVGDGSLVYSLTGLIPERISFKDFEKDGMELMRRVLSDDHYFNKKTYVTCFCDNEYRPKLPSQTTTLKKIDFGGGLQTLDKTSNPSIDGESEPPSATSLSSQGRMLGRLRDAASLAISVTTGKKLNISKNSTSANVITGFGYALMDIFENQFVDMDSIVKRKDEIEEVKSPFASPGKRGRRDKGMSKDEFKRLRREQKKKEQEERERREREPPKQYSVLKLKTSVGRYPVMNYLSVFTNDEVQEGKRCLLNRLRRVPEPERLESPTTAKIHSKHGTGPFTLNVQALDPNQPDKHEEVKERPEEKLLANLVEPKTRAPGGVWLLASDFPHAFQHFIVYHNINKYNHVQQFSDRWVDANMPYIVNEKEVVIKLELDEEALKLHNQNIINQYGSLDISKQSHNVSHVNDQSIGNIDESRIEGANHRIELQHQILPGEIVPAPVSFDQILLAYAPYPTKRPYDVLPRYLMKINQIEFNDEHGKAEISHSEDHFSDIDKPRPIEVAFKNYFEGKVINIANFNQDGSNVIWLKPNVVAPQGFQLWAAGLIRKISIVSKAEFLTQTKGFTLKNYNSDFLPLEKGKYHLFAKYDFQIHDDTTLNFKVDIPNDKYLLKYMRLKIVNKESSRKYNSQTENQLLLNQMRLENVIFHPNNGKGYQLIIEGVPPYNTTEGQMQIEVLASKDNFVLEEIIHVEPQEYQDKYFPTKYGIIFREKVFIGDNTAAAFNVRLKKQGKELDKIEGYPRRLFRFEVLDQGKIIFSKEGYNQITVSHFMFRTNAQLPENSENPDDEIKHAYVVQAVFDLHEWPCAKNENEESQDITWYLKVLSSETMALVKDTDKEDKERALKLSWEQAEPGRAEKAKKSRMKFLVQQKMRRGEELTEEEMSLAKEVRERIRKKDEPEQPVKGGKAPAKGAPAKAPVKDDKAKGKGAPVPVAQEDDEKNKRVLPEPSQHVNNDIRDFLQHYKSDRLLHITCDKTTQSRIRDPSERQILAEQRQKEREYALKEHEEELKKRELQKEVREKEKQRVFSDIEKSRQEYKEKMQAIMADRNKYREMIAVRKEKDKALQDLIAQDKIDLAQLQKAIDEAEANLVREEVITKGRKYLDWLQYCNSVIQSLQQALAEKNKENLLGVIDRIEKEQITIEPKMLNDAKNALSKMK